MKRTNIPNINLNAANAAVIEFRNLTQVFSGSKGNLEIRAGIR